MTNDKDRYALSLFLEVYTSETRLKSNIRCFCHILQTKGSIRFMSFSEGGSSPKTFLKEGYRYLVSWNLKELQLFYQI
jgi:hypothetical protein